MKDLISSNRYHITEALTESLAGELIKLNTLKIIQGDIIGNWAILNDFVFKNRKDITLRIGSDDFPFLIKLPEVEKIDFIANSFQDWSIFESFKKITALSINSAQKKIKPDLSFLNQYASSLKELGLEGDFKGIEHISNLKKVERLSFASTAINNLDFMSQLPLRNFFNYGSKIKNYTGLSGLQTLEILYIKKDTRIENLDFIESLSQLKELRLWYNSNISTLPNFGNLKSLELVEVFNSNKLRNIDSAIALKERCAVKIWGCKLLPKPDLGFYNQKGLSIH